MKSTQLLSVVFSLIMFTGVTASGTAYAESDDLDDILEGFCQMTIDERSDIVSKYDLDDYAEKLAIICDIEDEDEREESLEDVIDAIYLETRDIDDDYDDIDDDTEIDDDKDRDYYVRDGKNYDLDDRLEHFCDMTNDEKRQFFEKHPRLEQFSDRLANYCEMSEDERDDAIDEFIDKNKDAFRTFYDEDMQEHLTRYCEMSDEDKRAFIAEHDKTKDHVEKMNRYCTLDEKNRMKFIDEHRDEYIAKMKDKMTDKMHDKMTKHMDYERFCNLTDADLAVQTFDAEFVDRASKWCNMTPEEREDYKREHHDSMKDKMTDIAKDKLHDKMKLSDKSDRLKAMIMTKHDISDERRDEIKMKFKEKYGDLTDEKKSELKMKFKDHMKSIKVKMSDERKASIHDRLAEMKAFKAELRANASDMTDEEKQQLREEFIEKAKDMQLAWISPRTQITAGIDAAEVECREGFSLVMKASNGVPMCLKANTALKMIEKGIAVPAN